MKFLDTDDSKLNLKVYIKHRNVIFVERIRMFKGKKMKILKETQLTTNISRYLIITLLTSYKNNILYYLSTHEIGFIIIP